MVAAAAGRDFRLEVGCDAGGIRVRWRHGRAFVSFWFNQQEGGVAQLVEHQLCKLGVAGSNPVASTNEFTPMLDDL